MADPEIQQYAMNPVDRRQAIGALACTVAAIPTAASAGFFHDVPTTAKSKRRKMGNGFQLNEYTMDSVVWWLGFLTFCATPGALFGTMRGDFTNSRPGGKGKLPIGQFLGGKKGADGLYSKGPWATGRRPGFKPRN